MLGFLMGCTCLVNMCRYDMSRGDSRDTTRDIHDAGDDCPLCANKSPTEGKSR